ncbi:MAG: polysaccharide biosynthesis protein [Pseudomonadales bacterium]|nr:polysaccharide biosynthesis protein [Pseudomonadales bacterium]
MLKRLLKLPRYQKRFVSILADILFLPFALWSAFSLRLEEFYIPSDHNIYIVGAITVFSTVLVFTRLGLYRAVIRFMSNHAMIAVISGVTLSALVLVFISFIFAAPVPLSVPIIYCCLAMIFVGGTRMLMRSVFHKNDVKSKTKVVIYGAGKSGLQLSSVLFHGNELEPIAFVDDDRRKQGSILNGINVYSPEELPQVLSKYSVTNILLALGQAPRSQRSLIIRFLETYPVKVQTIPDINEIVKGKARIEEIREVEIEDLLGRDSVAPDTKLLAECISGKSVMVTGAGGSIGSELCRQIVKLKPSKLILFESSEYALYQIEQELSCYADKTGDTLALHAILGSVQKQDRIEAVMNSFKVDTVYHAAAYKHVPLVEQNIIEGTRNNVFGTWYCAEAAINAKVETFVLISSDKAVRPTNVMGASKRLSELILQGLAQRQRGTRFCMVRFGNVLGSSGSVVPLFRKQIREGGPVTVTHENITRYFMTVQEAAELVLQAGSMGEGGDVFVLDMGKSVRIAELAKKLIHLMGMEVKDEANPAGDIEIKYSGLRPGEKLYEELLIGDNVSSTNHPGIRKAIEHCLPWEEVAKSLQRLDHACQSFDCQAVLNEMLKAPLGYAPSSEVNDLVWQQDHPFDQAQSIRRSANEEIEPAGHVVVSISDKAPINLPSF